jgi:hypothetical protein
VLKIPAAPFWYAADAIFAVATAVQLVVVALDIGYLVGTAARPAPPQH